MKTIFSTDPEGAQRFLDTIKFSELFSPRTRAGTDDVLPIDQYEIKPGNNKTEVWVQAGILIAQDFCQRLIEECGLTHKDTTEMNIMTQAVNFDTPFGFTFHVVVVFA